VASHGGTHYVVRRDETEQLLVVHPYAASVSVDEGDRYTSADVFRCQ
jgi:hypothetical protein